MHGRISLLVAAFGSAEVQNLDSDRFCKCLKRPKWLDQTPCSSLFHSVHAPHLTTSWGTNMTRPKPSKPFTGEMHQVHLVEKNSYNMLISFNYLQLWNIHDIHCHWHSRICIFFKHLLSGLIWFIWMDIDRPNGYRGQRNGISTKWLFAFSHSLWPFHKPHFATSKMTSTNWFLAFLNPY